MESNSPRENCPPPSQLLAFHRGDLPESATEALAAHLEGCRLCEQDLDALDAQEGSIVSDLRSGKTASEAAGELLAKRYRLEQQVGEGGMGAVWRAEQLEPVQRQVAIKLVKAGMDTRAVLRRFAAEQQALALMDHPNIARVFDAGVTTRGRPFFVMELVPGVPITQYCDEHRLNPQERLNLFISVCRAIQHAHQKGIIHRDLKPSNVLVAEVDGRPVPKVIDFGIAKAVGVKLGHESVATGLGMVLGTPEYMAPEQAGGDPVDVDTRADVYALGVLLYELLTGSTPLTRQRCRQAALLEILRIVREEDPPPPSSRLSSLDTLPSVAANRNTEPARLSRLLRGELDWVALKALEKDRSRRYDTASGLARDIERYLAEEPVEAGRPTRIYRLRKFAQRHRRPLFFAFTLVVLLVTATTVSSWLAFRATRAEKQAIKERDEKETAQRKTASALAEREKELTRRTAIQEFYSKRILQAGRPKGAENGLGKDVTLRAAIDAAVASLDTAFPGQPEIEAAIRHKLAESYHLMDDQPTALKHYERAAKLWEEAGLPPDDPERLQTANDIGTVLIHSNRWPEAAAALERVLESRRKVHGNDHIATAQALNNLSVVYYYMGRTAESVTLLEEAYKIRKAQLGERDVLTLRSMLNLASIYPRTGKIETAIKMMEELVAIRRTLDETPTTANPLNTHLALANLAGLYSDAKRSADAMRILSEVVPLQRANLGSDHQYFLDTLQRMGSNYLSTGQPVYARWTFAEVVATRRRKFGPRDAKLPEALSGWAKACLLSGRTADCERHYAESAETGRTVYAKDPVALATLLGEIGHSLDDANLSKAAEPYLREKLTVLAATPSKGAHAEAQSRLGVVLAKLGQNDEAKKLLLAGQATLATLANETESNRQLLIAIDRLIEFYNRIGQPDEAKRWQATRARYPDKVNP